MLAWIAFAEDDTGAAVRHMREAADLQDEAGEGEVDIPAGAGTCQGVRVLHETGVPVTPFLSF